MGGLKSITYFMAGYFLATGTTFCLCEFSNYSVMAWIMFLQMVPYCVYLRWLGHETVLPQFFDHDEFFNDYSFFGVGW